MRRSFFAGIESKMLIMPSMAGGSRPRLRRLLGLRPEHGPKPTAGALQLSGEG